MLEELNNEHEAVTQAILVLERIALGRGPRRGRPPTWMTAIKSEADHRAAKPNRRTKRLGGSSVNRYPFFAAFRFFAHTALARSAAALRWAALHLGRLRV
jgi:hypothetical protein